MSLITIATFTMKRGREKGALKLIAAVKREARAKQPGTLTYLVHRKLDQATGKPTRELWFYEVYRSKAALDKHLASASWQAVQAHWTTFFEGSATKIEFFGLERIAAFTRSGAIPLAR